MSERIKKGIFFSLLTAAISGFSIFYNKMIVVKGIDPLTFNLIKNGGVAFLLSLLLFSSPNRGRLFKLPLSQWRRLLLIGFVGGGIPFILFFEGLRQVSALNANLIHKTLFIWVAALAIPFLGEMLNTWQIIGYLLVVWSNFFLGGFSGFTGSLGEVMILIATILWSIENIIAKITLKETKSTIVAWGRMFFGSLILFIIAAMQNKLPLLIKLTPNQIIIISGSILLLAAYVITWYKALQFAPATIVSSVLILATPITNILTTIFITQKLPGVQFINFIITSLGIGLITVLIPKSLNKNESTWSNPLH